MWVEPYSQEKSLKRAGKNWRIPHNDTQSSWRRGSASGS
jgi:hypothetical protein